MLLWLQVSKIDTLLPNIELTIIHADVPVILEIIKELALYEKEPDKVLATQESLHDTLGFKEGSKRYAKTLLLYEDDKPAGMAL